MWRADPGSGKGESLRPPLVSGPRVKPGCADCGSTVGAALAAALAAAVAARRRCGQPRVAEGGAAANDGSKGRRKGFFAGRPTAHAAGATGGVVGGLLGVLGPSGSGCALSSRRPPARGWWRHMHHRSCL